MKKILLVDDDKIHIEAIKKKLESSDYDVKTASDGDEAVHILQHNKEDFGLIILDLIMPKMHGFEVVYYMEHSNITDIPVIILSNISTNSKSDIVVEYLIKSDTSLDKLMDTVKKHLS